MSIVKNITSEDNLDWREIVINWEGMGDDVTEIKAGTPMDAEGNIANNGNCFGLMMGDVLRTRSRARVVISGPVDLDEAEANSGITLTDEAKAAMRDVWFPGKSGGGLPTGGAAYQQLVTDGEGKARWEDRLCHATERVKVDMSGQGTLWHYKVSDAIPTGDLSAGAVATIWNSLSGKHTVNSLNIADGIYLYDGALVVLNDNIEANGFVFPEKGTYFFAQDKFNYTAGFALGEATTPEITWDGNIEIIKKLDEKYLQNHTVVFTEDANGHVTCNISYDDLGYLVYFGVPIVSNFVSTGNYCATIQAFKFKYDDSSIQFLFTAFDDGNLEMTYKCMYNPDGTIVKQVK